MTDDIDIDTKKSLILKQVCFSQFNDEETEILASILVEKHFFPGDTIVNQGDRVDSIYLIVNGTVDIRLITYNPDHTQKATSVATLGPGAAIGLSDTGFYSLTGLRTATVVAIDEITALRLSVAAFNGFALSYSRVTQVMRAHASAILSGRSVG
jgi:CRP-like cAMP-binding protein